jgi:hypothetical protein
MSSTIMMMKFGLVSAVCAPETERASRPPRAKSVRASLMRSEEVSGRIRNGNEEGAHEARPSR